MKVVIAAKGVPVGDYTLQVLQKLKLNAVLNNVVSRETDVREVLAKVALDEADAGFVYSTDARTVPKKVRTVSIPPRGRPNIEYGICVVARQGTSRPGTAFVKRVLSNAGQRILLRYGFLPPEAAVRRRDLVVGALAAVAAAVALAFLVLPVVGDLPARSARAAAPRSSRAGVVTDALIVTA